MSDEEPVESLFSRTRHACAEVTRLARSVRIDDAALDRFAALLARERPRLPELDPAHRLLGGPAQTLAYVVTLNAINFGSGWFPHLRKRPGQSGYLTLSHALRERFEKEGPWSAGELRALRPEDCARVFGQELASPIDELMTLFARALNELGELLLERHQGSFTRMVESAGQRAESLVEVLAEMPLYRDVSIYQGFEVPFYKRAQITCADLALALRGHPLGHFTDLDQLTLFADNLVPHVLRMLGILVYDLLLDLRINREELLPHDSEEEVEIRAVALHAVECLQRSCAGRGYSVPTHRLDNLLWSRGQDPKIKASPATAPQPLQLLLMRRGSPIILDAQLYFMLAVLALLVGVAALQGGAPLVRQGLGDGGALLIRYGAIITVSFLAAGLAQALIPREVVQSALGREAGLRGIVLATLAGMLTPSGPFVSMPVAAVLLRSGAAPAAVVAFLTAWSLLALHRLVAWEVPILGVRFALARYGVSLLLPILAGLLARSLFRNA